MRILILHDELPHNATLDQQDTLNTAHTVQHTLSSLGWECELLPWRDDLSQNVALFQPREELVLFNLLESIHEDCRLNYRAALLAASMQLAYTGGSALDIWLTTDKILTKELLKAFDLPTAPWISWDDGNIDALQQFLQQHGPVLIKPRCEDSSVGIHEHCFICEPSDITRFLHYKEAHIHSWFAEKYIEGREFNVSVWAIDGIPHILPIPELQFSSNWGHQKPKIVDYDGKWLAASAAFTSRSFELPQTDAVLQKLRAIVLQGWKMLQLSGYARFDIRVDEHNHPWILEINVNPALFPDAGFAAAANEANIAYLDVLKTIVQEAQYRYTQRR